MARRSALFIAAIIVLLGGLLGSCATTSAGPQAWIDNPLDNTTAPLAPLSIIAHASDSDGIARIEFAVNGESYKLVEAGGGRLEWKEVEWNPPAPGTYRIGARGIDASGAEGAYSTSLVTISGESPPPLPLPAPLTATVITPVVTITPITPEAPTIITITPITPEAPTSPRAIAKMNGNCREGPGTVYDAYGTLMEGQQAEIKGRLADNSWLLVALLGQSMNCWISASVVEVQGDLASVRVAAAPPPPASGGQPPSGGEQPPAAEPPPPVDVLPPAPIEVDDPPSFYKIDVARNACPANTVTVAALVTDDKGVSGVVANWSLSSGESGQVGLGQGWIGYVATIGPMTEGTMQIRMVATDTAGQAVPSNWLLLDFKQCVK